MEFIGRNTQPGFEVMEFACVESEQHYVESEGGKPGKQ